MRVYINLPLNFSIDDQDIVEEKCETYIYTKQGIYQKYKKHFFTCECDGGGIPKTRKVVDGEHEYLIQENSLKINKKKLLTSIPYNCYFVNRFVKKCYLDHNITFVKELDNDHFESCYFDLNNIEQLKYIGLYVKKKL
tara:strand:+ start:606 stop:1019 length:414 start_codon:yes stop_codon:yes gene_type:complete